MKNKLSSSSSIEFQLSFFCQKVQKFWEVQIYNLLVIGEEMHQKAFSLYLCTYLNVTMFWDLIIANFMVLSSKSPSNDDRESICGLPTMCRFSLNQKYLNMKWLIHVLMFVKEIWLLSLIGKVNQYEWCSVMGCVLDMDLPWRTLRPKLARCDENGMVAYETTFEEMRIYHRYSGVCLMN